jgi:dTDP-4-dehydrorhamnose reductase
LFVSTDFVFDGEKGMYDENDTVSPVNFYGKTKLEAEESVMTYADGWAIVRTVLVYGKPMFGRQNILSIVKDKLEKGELYSVVNDQVRTPTYVEDLASAIISIIEKKAEGVFHISGSDILTPFDMAYRTAVYLGLDKELIKPVSSPELMQPAKRPLKTGFIIDKAKTVLGYNPISFEEGLKKTFGDNK